MAEDKGQIWKDAMGQAVLGVQGTQQEQAEGQNGWKITLLAWAFKQGPVMVAAGLISVFAFSVYSSQEEKDQAIWVSFQQRQNQDMEFMRSIAASNASIAASMDQLVQLAKEDKERDRQELNSMKSIERTLHEFTSGVEREHGDQTRMIRETWQRSMQ